MKHKDSKPWNRKPTDIMSGNISAKKNLSTYKIANNIKKLGLIGSFVCIKITLISWNFRKEKILYAGQITDAVVSNNRPFIRFKRYNRYYKLGLVEHGDGFWLHMDYEADIASNNPVLEISPDMLIKFEDGESAELYASMAD